MPFLNTLIEYSVSGDSELAVSESNMDFAVGVIVGTSDLKPDAKP